MRRRDCRAVGPPGSRAASVGLALEVRDLVGLALGLLLGARELVLRLALALLLLALAPGRGVAGEVADGLLGAARDLVCNTHERGLPGQMIDERGLDPSDVAVLVD